MKARPLAAGVRVHAVAAIAIDSSVHEEPAAIVEIARGTVTTEAIVVHATRYSAATPAGVVLFVEHTSWYGKARELRRATDGKLVVEDRVPTRRALSLAELDRCGPAEIEAALAASPALPPEIVAHVRALLVTRSHLPANADSIARPKLRKQARAIRYAP